MSETTHSPEPWKAYPERDPLYVLDATGRTLVDFDRGGSIAYFHNALDARRVAACVNACAGIPTDALEKGTLAEFLTHVQAMLILIRNGIPPDDTARVGRIILSELGRHP